MTQLLLTLVMWTYLLKTQTSVYAEAPQGIVQIQIDDKMTAAFHVTIHNRKIATLWDTGASKSVISEKCL